MFHRFKIDINYVGEPPAIEVTVTNLNDNIDEKFLADMAQKCGAFEELIIYTHPVTKKHLHLARIVFMEVPPAKLFINKFNEKSVMGKVCSGMQNTVCVT